MAIFEVTLEIEAHNENEIMAKVYGALYAGGLDLRVESVQVRPLEDKYIVQSGSTRLLGSYEGRVPDRFTE